MHCPAIPSNLDRAKQAFIDSMEQPCARSDQVYLPTHHALNRAYLMIATKAV
jgi:hypothetical protein